MMAASAPRDRPVSVAGGLCCVELPAAVGLLAVALLAVGDGVADDVDAVEVIISRLQQNK
jgi:hypothetical protein